jgi:hypothetical protein
MSNEERAREATLITTARACVLGAAGPAAAAIAEHIVDLKRALVDEMEATDRLRERIELLNLWLLGFTITGIPLAVLSLAVAIVALLWKR